MCKYSYEEERDGSHIEASKEAADAPFAGTPDANVASAAHHHVYYRSDDHGWIPARVRSIDENNHEAIVTVDNYEDEQGILQCGSDDYNSIPIAVDLRAYPEGVLPLQNTTEAGELLEYEDMVDMPYLHEASILYNLKSRHADAKPYTRAGDVIIAMNPYSWYSYLYQSEEQKYYADKLLWENLSTSIHHDSQLHTPKHVAPHVYETATLAYKGMALWNHPQSILVSGESGAGKTETVKICMDQIATLQLGPDPDWDEPPTQVVDRIMEANPLLEAFGNSQTRRNDNSSRFGRYISLQFERQTMSRSCRSPARLVGSTCEVYLLEKNRVVNHDPEEERTFHILYQLLAAKDQQKSMIWSGLAGKAADSFSYVGKTQTRAIRGRSDRQRFYQTVDAFRVLGIPHDQLIDLFRSLCVVLQLGNLAFASDSANDDKAVITSEAELDGLASLMGLTKDDIRCDLTERTMIAANEVYNVPLSADAAKESCDALAKDIYEKVFLWLVQSINRATCAANNDQIKQQRFGTISLLDIFGFEAYFVNRFEQLCINYANEKLQFKFTEDCFRLVQAEYREQGIALENIQYDDNTDVLDLIEGRTGLLAMLNEECRRPQGNAAAFVQKALHENQKSHCLLANTMDRVSFGVHHYAGKVLYDADDFVFCNQDRLPTNLKECAARTSNPIISNQYKIAVAEDRAGQRDGPSSNSHVKAKTVWTKYKHQLTKLMADLHQTESRYIRCVKPNRQKQPLVIEHNVTIAQLRSCGIVASCTIARSAFPNRMDNKKVVSRFGGIWHQGNKTASSAIVEQKGEEKWKAEAQTLLSFALKSRDYIDARTGETKPPFIVGNTKTFFRPGALEYLEAERINGLDKQAIIIQRRYRSYVRHKRAILEAKELRRRLANHRNMAKLRRAKSLEEERARQEMEAREEEMFQQRTAAKWDELQARLAAKHRLFLQQLDEADAKQQVQLEEENRIWREKMDREEREFEARIAEERKQWALEKDGELNKLNAEIAALQQRMVDMDRECAEKVNAYTKRCRDAQKQKKDFDVKEWRHGIRAYLGEKEVQDRLMFCGVILEERKKQIKILKREKKFLAQELEKTGQKKSEIIQINENLENQCKAAGITFEKTRQLSLSIHDVANAREVAHQAAKLENQVLHEEIANEKKKFTLLTLCKLELQHALARILDVTQYECNNRDLRNAVLDEVIRTTKAAHRQMKVVQELVDEQRVDESSESHSSEHSFACSSIEL